MAGDEIIFGLPSKGRLKEQCEAWLVKRGLFLKQTGGERGYAAHFDGEPMVEVRLMSSSEISKSLLAGEMHLGITGEDLIREQSPKSDEQVEFVHKLGFGRADVVVAVPDGWIDVSTMGDLAEVASDIRRTSGKRMRIATKFARLTTEFFEKCGVLDYRIVYSGSATEGAPANGIAEAIVDITTSGATLIANNLKIIDDGLILSSQACLIKSRIATLNPKQSALMNELTRKFG